MVRCTLGLMWQTCAPSLTSGDGKGECQGHFLSTEPSTDVTPASQRTQKRSPGASGNHVCAHRKQLGHVLPQHMLVHGTPNVGKQKQRTRCYYPKRNYNDLRLISYVWLEQKHICLFKSLRPWNWHPSQKYFLRGNFYFFIKINIWGKNAIGWHQELA